MSKCQVLEINGQERIGTFDVTWLQQGLMTVWGAKRSRFSVILSLFAPPVKIQLMSWTVTSALAESHREHRSRALNPVLRTEHTGTLPELPSGLPHFWKTAPKVVVQWREGGSPGRHWRSSVYKTKQLFSSKDLCVLLKVSFIVNANTK
jgi:hypothetical protein